MKKNNFYKTLPNSESGHTCHCYTASGKKYDLTENPLTKIYTLWEVLEEGFNKIKSGDNPHKLFDLIPWHDLDKSTDSSDG